MALLPGIGPAPGPPSGMMAPQGPSPASMPSQPGLEAQARVELNQAVRFLINYLGKVKGVGTDEAKAVIDALKALAKATPDVSEALSQSEMAVLAGNAQAVRPGQAPTMLGTPRPVPQMIAGGGMR